MINHVLPGHIMIEQFLKRVRECDEPEVSNDYGFCTLVNALIVGAVVFALWGYVIWALTMQP